MKNLQLYLAILFLVLALVIFIFADGYRRYYSGFFFTVMGMVLLAHAIYKNYQQKNAHK